MIYDKILYNYETTQQISQIYGYRDYMHTMRH